MYAQIIEDSVRVEHDCAVHLTCWMIRTELSEPTKLLQ